MSKTRDQWLDASGGHYPFSIKGMIYTELNQKVKHLITEMDSRNLSNEEKKQLHQSISTLQRLASNDNEFE